METVKPILTCSVQFRREKYKTVAKTGRHETLSKTNLVRLSHVIQHSPTSCAQFDPKRVSAYKRPRSISVYQVRPLVGLNSLDFYRQIRSEIFQKRCP